MNTIVKKQGRLLIIEGSALPSKIYYKQTDETRIWNDFTKKEKEEAMTIMAERIMNVLGYRLIEMNFDN